MGGPDPEIVESQEDMDMRDAPRAPAAERQADPLPARQIPQAPAGPTVMTVGSTDSSVFAIRLTSSIVTASIRPWRLSI